MRRGIRMRRVALMALVTLMAAVARIAMRRAGMARVSAGTRTVRAMGPVRAMGSVGGIGVNGKKAAEDHRHRSQHQQPIGRNSALFVFDQVPDALGKRGEDFVHATHKSSRTFRSASRFCTM